MPRGRKQKRKTRTNWQARAAAAEKENAELGREIGTLRETASALRTIAEALAPLLRDEIESVVDEKLDELTISR